jgi:hypothetical protein
MAGLYMPITEGIGPHEAGSNGVICSLLGVAAALGILPEGLMQADVLTVVLALTGIGSVMFWKTAKARIG